MATLHTSYFLYCESEVHAGDGTSIGTIDSPIQRERTTSFPNFRDSTLRGAIREPFDKGEHNGDLKHLALFGNKSNGDKNSALDVYSARLLFFPVRSATGIFAYVTCPFVLKRFEKDINLLHGSGIINIKGLNNDLKDMNTIASAHLTISNTNKVSLEEFLFTQKREQTLKEITINEKPINDYFFNATNVVRLKDYIALVPDTVFKHLVNLFTVKVTRNKIDVTTGTAIDGGLFNAEYLPEESLLYTTFGFSNEFKKDGENAKDLQSFFKGHMGRLIRLGGDKSIGKGLIRTIEIKAQKEN